MKMLQFLSSENGSRNSIWIKLIRVPCYQLFSPDSFLRTQIKHVYRKLTKNSIFYEEREIPMCSLSVERKLAKTLELFGSRSILDIGCGTGKSLDYFYEKGIEVLGIEGSRLAIAKSNHPELILNRNLNFEVNLRKKFDLIWCLEVVEHIHPKYVHNLLRTFSNHADRIVMSAAVPGQGGEGHFNEQPPEYWIQKLGEYGYVYNEEKSGELQKINEVFSSNMLVFERL